MSRDLVALPAYGGRYAVSADGAVFSHVSKHYMRPQKHPQGYRTVALTLRNGKGGKQQHLIHVLVAEAFLQNPDGKATVNHKDGNKANNAVGNLEWATHGENHAHAYRELGRKPHLATLRDTSRRCVCVAPSGEATSYSSVKAAAAALGVKERGAARACRGERKTYAGLVWAYV